MRKIVKGEEPPVLTDLKRKNSGKGYQNLNREIRQSIRTCCFKEQFGLCAYCCKPIDEKNCVNEHVVAQRINPRLSLDYNNIVASCSTKGQCDDAHGSQPLPLTPLMNECETELCFRLSGRVEGLTKRAQQSIKVLGLDNRALKETRKQMIDALIFIHGSYPHEIEVLDNDLMGLMIEELEEVDENQILPAFAPILVNILRQLLE